MAKHSNQICQFVQTEMAKKADPNKAIEMAAYMKTEMPFYGVQKPERLPIYKELQKKFIPSDQNQYRKNVLSLWSLPHREEKYAALEYASAFRTFATPETMPLFRQLIEDGAWWDFVDPIAINLVGHAFIKFRPDLHQEIIEWSNDQNMWIRRTSLICQNHHKKQTDEKLLFATCLHLCHEKEFFIRKAIGWALREYSYTAPVSVKAFIIKNQDRLSPLSFREAAKQLVRSGELKI